MENLKGKITNKLKEVTEAKIMVNPEQFDDVVDKLGADDIVKLTDEGVVSEGGVDRSHAEGIINDLQNVLHDLFRNYIDADVHSELYDMMYEKIYWGIMDAYDDYRRSKGGSIDEVNQEVMQKFIDQYGKEKGEQVYYATANKQDRDPETFHTEEFDGEDYERASREVEYGINPEIGEEEWAKLLALSGEEPPRDNMNEEGEDVNQGGEQQNVNMDKMRRDVQKFIDRLNLSQFSNILSKIDTPLEKAEVIAAFSEVIGVPRAKLPMVTRMLKVQAESVKPKMTKDALVEHVLKTRKKEIKWVD